MSRYEEVRRTLLGGHPEGMRWGLAVLRTKGMAAWARAWWEYGESGIRPSQPSASAVSSPLPPNTEEVVRVLAAMVWAIQEEAVP